VLADVADALAAAAARDGGGALGARVAAALGADAVAAHERGESAAAC